MTTVSGMGLRSLPNNFFYERWNLDLCFDQSNPTRLGFATHYSLFLFIFFTTECVGTNTFCWMRLHYLPEALLSNTSLLRLLSAVRNLQYDYIVHSLLHTIELWLSYRRRHPYSRCSNGSNNCCPIADVGTLGSNPYKMLPQHSG